MKRQLQSIAFLFALLGLVGVNAATITYQTRNINAGVNNSDYKASWHSQTSGVTTGTLTDFDMIWGGNNTFSHLAVNFSSGLSQLSFQLAVDAGYGGALYLDNVLVAKETKDLWWGYNWNNTSQLLSSYANTLSSGNHVLEAFWAEGCCNGANSGRFSQDGGANWQKLSATNLDALAPVPVPAAVWLFGSALLGLFGWRSKKILAFPLAA
jgi:hypothetical protein